MDTNGAGGLDIDRFEQERRTKPAPPGGLAQR
jgi:hypothetical protein